MDGLANEDWGWSERLLFRVCRRPDDPALGGVERADQSPTSSAYQPQGRFEELLEKFPGLSAEAFRGGRVIDFGSGEGHLAFDLGAHAGRVVGLEIRDAFVERASAQAERLGLDNVEFANSTAVRPEDHRSDIIISVDSFEHFDDPAAILATCARLLKPDGRMLVTFGPAWLHPKGHHLSFLCRVPWFHLFFSERTIMNVRSLYRDDGARRFADVPGGLNRMTLRRFRRCVAASPFEFEALHLIPIRGCGPPARVPLLREMFISVISGVLKLKS